MKTVEFPSGTYRVTGKILIPSYIVINGNNSTLNGNTAGTMFESAYVSGTNVISNIGTPDESHRVVSAQVSDLIIINSKLAFNLFNFNEISFISNIQFLEVDQCVIASRSFYGGFKNLICRNASKTSALPAFTFSNYVNVENIKDVFVAGRKLAFVFSGGINGLQLTNLSAEDCTNGISFLGEVNPLTISTCYFEGITGTAIDMNDAAAHRAVTIDNNWFYNVGICFSGKYLHQGCFRRGNYADANCTNIVIIDDDYTSLFDVEINNYMTPTNGILTLPPKYQIGRKCTINGTAIIYDGGSGLPMVKANISHSNNLINLDYSGDCGYVGNAVAFCSQSKSAGTTFNINIDTSIRFSEYCFYVFKLRVVDNSGSTTVQGNGFGSTITLNPSSQPGKTVTAINNSGNLRLILSSYYHPTEYFNVEGILRIV
ncbi:glycosyl hydrolase family 28-related protein [Pedobacter panaciterrae]